MRFIFLFKLLPFIKYHYKKTWMFICNLATVSQSSLLAHSIVCGTSNQVGRKRSSKSERGRGYIKMSRLNLRRKVGNETKQCRGKSFVCLFVYMWCMYLCVSCLANPIIVIVLCFSSLWLCVFVFALLHTFWVLVIAIYFFLFLF